MQVPLVMTMIGQDRPGLVEMVARLVASHGGNWLESRMCRLGGQFAGILRIQVAEPQQAALTRTLQDLATHGLSVVVHPDDAVAPTPGGRLALIELVGQDRPGIVRHISSILAAQGVNVEELRTECVSAPMTGELLFKAQARLQVPPVCNLANLRRELERAAGDLVVDVSLSTPEAQPR